MQTKRKSRRIGMTREEEGNLMSTGELTETSIKVGDRIVTKTRGGGLYSGSRIFVLLDEPNKKVCLPQGTLIRFEDTVEMIGAYLFDGPRAPGGFLNENDKEAIYSERDDPPLSTDPPGSKYILRILKFTRSGKERHFHYIHPGQIATVVSLPDK